ncbi:type II/IV secretion system protein [Ruficoccus amylovorans]|uniref:Type II/IV secretion system protein n=1 Tax=Ruficoccus amylovorans TaxID=1804625 RepID=A0A842HM34_9BACT|nr:GspE/PulE family protein [Ruficoccus amylovorans]MBC2596161.1 type II/IV secretion system protein [Ruficoccus amylovorans]
MSAHTVHAADRDVLNLPPIQRMLEGVDPSHMQALADAPRAKRLSLLSDMTGLSERELLVMISNGTGLDVLDRFEADAETAAAIPIRMMLRYQSVPIKPPPEWGDVFCMATSWPPDDEMRQWLYSAVRREITFFLVLPEKLNQFLVERFGVGSDSLDDPEMQAFLDQTAEKEEEKEDENAAIIRFVNEVIAQAMRDRATDIHFEPRRESLQIRYRIDGRLVQVPVPKNLVAYQGAIISRIKIMSRLNISEKRRPQDGRITYGGGRDEVDVRVSTLPTMYGESISMRLLSEQSQPASIQDLGFIESDEHAINKILDLPHGIMLITGPTGSGKSTTLSAFMHRLGTPERRVITVEDPIEYEIPEVNQTQVNHEIGLTFASALRSVLRQDPDVIMVGEIRDRETADIAVRASLTGHLVLSTLHTNDAPGAITRLIDMEIEPFLIASSVEMVIAQRLVRRLCQSCAKVDDADITYVGSCLMSLGLPPSEIQYAHGIKKPCGCEDCRNLGYRGRIGLYEILRVDDTVHDLIYKQASARELRKRALEHGMRTLQGCGWHHVKHGLTSLSEIMRYADLQSEDETVDSKN